VQRKKRLSKEQLALLKALKRLFDGQGPTRLGMKLMERTGRKRAASYNTKGVDRKKTQKK